ncbi:MAG: HDOD domain-containing protein [Armatimonadota bacterium]|nr:HDOD domain-containing protein [Armatimonadota bacterium]MDR5703368.1 HDOD domain-containing protein [Armatimonadota bacterium]MDR7435775.1 HDOD domain-containing protein [Armatimonadota bacterium]
MPKTMEQILAKVQDLQPLPRVVTRALEVIRDPRSSAVDVGRVISTDQALTARVLKLANSAFYRRARRISTVSEAVVILGFEAVKAQVTAAAAYDLLHKPIPGYQLAQEELWKHSLTCAIASRQLVLGGYGHAPLRGWSPEEAFVAGLLHDIGKTVLGEYVGVEFQQILEKVRNEGISFVEAEQQVLGFDHMQVGAMVAEKWHFPDHLVEAIRFHHRPRQASRFPQWASLVHIADAVSLMLGIGLGGDQLYYSLEPEALQILGLPVEAVDHLLASMVDLTIDLENPLDL